jgi:molybdenum cofactor guanylyltransferase
VNRAGFVLVGGRSSRMGRDKAFLPFRGGVLAQAVAEAVREAAGSVCLVGAVRRAGSLPYAVLPDLYPGEGPLGAILTVLENQAADRNLIVACDMPELSAPFLSALFQAAEDTDADVLIPAGPSGRLEPLCAVYHRRARQPLYQAFLAGTRKVTDAFAGLHVPLFPVSEFKPLQNVNTPEDWALYAAD